MISRIELCQVFTILSANNNKCSPDISDSKSHISASDDILETNYFNSLQKKKKKKHNALQNKQENCLC